MKKKILIMTALFFGASFCVQAQEAINGHLEASKKAILSAGIKKMSKVANALNDATRSAIKDELGDDTYKKYRKVYIKEETARWHAGTNKVKDKSLSKDEKTLANSHLKTRNKLEIVVREGYGDIKNIIQKLESSVKKVIEEYS